jgi:uncharacterized YigZ family protein
LNPEHYHTIEKSGEAEYRDRGSRFLAIVFPIRHVSDFKEQYQLIKKQHPKAVHHCFAYRIGTDGLQFRANDDGEPSGTAGKPILGQIDSKQLVNVAVVVVRYFGGTLLGVPGLIQAYKTSAALALQMVPMVKKPIMVAYVLECNSTDIHMAIQLVKQSGGEVIKLEHSLFSICCAEIPLSAEADFLYRMQDMHHVTCKKNQYN